MNLFSLGAGKLTSCCHSVFGINKKRRKNPPCLYRLLDLLSFCLVCEISLCTSFREKRFCHHSLSYQFLMCHQSICIPCLLPGPKPKLIINFFSFGRSRGTLGALTPATFGGKSFQLSRVHRLCCCPGHCCGRVAMSVSGFPCTNGSSFLLQGFRHKTAV